MFGQAALVAEIFGDNFGEAVLEYVSRTATIANLSVFYFPDLTHPKPIQSVWAGRIDDYWLRRNGTVIANDPALYLPVLEDVRASPTSGIHIERWHPSDSDPIKFMFDQFNVIERVTTASRKRSFGYKTFFLRDKADGWISDSEYDALCNVLVFVHELIGLRHRLLGSGSFQFVSGPSASSLRERPATQFSRLSKREAQVCDYVLNGMTVAGTALDLCISETTVRTLRRRAYRKLNVTSAAQLMVLVADHLRHE